MGGGVTGYPCETLDCFSEGGKVTGLRANSNFDRYETFWICVV